MKNFIAIKPEEIKGNPFQMIGSDWMLVTAQMEDKVNTMTASWGGLGVMWEMNVAYVVLRPSRYTKVFVDAADTFSLTFFDPSYQETLNYLGTVSGRDEPKIAKSGLTVCQAGDTPYFAEGRLVLICRKLYHQPYNPKGFTDPAIDSANYPGKDYHTLYIGEITKVLAESV
jgi:flavin reductase (DIM6/NTAB) family NADH-FMN oxidoreductase RutF